MVGQLKFTTTYYVSPEGGRYLDHWKIDEFKCQYQFNISVFVIYLAFDSEVKSHVLEK